jgi:2'-hydroxyisoflavone reductase
VLDTCRAEVGADGARFTWVDDRFIGEACSEPMRLLPLWAPSMPTAPAVRCWRAIRAGLRFRPLAETVRDTHAWDVAHSSPRPGALTPEHEADLLRAWHASHRD